MLFAHLDHNIYHCKVCILGVVSKNMANMLLISKYNRHNHIENILNPLLLQS